MKMCCSCSTCACCTVFIASLILATIFTSGYLIIKKDQVDKYVSRDFKKKFFSLFNFFGTYGKVYIKRSLTKTQQKPRNQYLNTNGNQTDVYKIKQQTVQKPTVRVRVRPTRWPPNG